MTTETPKKYVIVALSPDAEMPEIIHTGTGTVAERVKAFRDLDRDDDEHVEEQIADGNLHARKAQLRMVLFDDEFPILGHNTEVRQGDKPN